MNQDKVLKLSTSGSVDDGKSTLIGRILYDTKSLKSDKLKAIEESSRQKGYDHLDFSLATDGLVAEREQGITIDVAHIYFSTPNRSYIIADTPGHKEYTRNMITGASTSQVAIILIDARNGVMEQTRRHFFINNLIRTREIIVAVNKMDLVGYSQDKFEKIVKDFEQLTQQAEYKNQNIKFIPVSALYGDNVVQKSSKLDWYTGKSLMDYLENIKIGDIEESRKARLQVQTVIRPKREAFHDYRGYAGKLKGGELKVGDEVSVLPSKQKSKIKTIEFFNQQYESASAGSSLTITLTDDINISRGDIIVKTGEEPKESKTMQAIICWMDSKELKPNSIYYLQHGINVVKSKIESVDKGLNKLISNENDHSVEQLEMNDLGLVSLKFAQPMNYDSYAENKENGAFILIDTQTNNTAGVGFIQ